MIAIRLRSMYMRSVSRNFSIIILITLLSLLGLITVL